MSKTSDCWRPGTRWGLKVPAITKVWTCHIYLFTQVCAVKYPSMLWSFSFKRWLLKILTYLLLLLFYEYSITEIDNRYSDVWSGTRVLGYPFPSLQITFKWQNNYFSICENGWEKKSTDFAYKFTNPLRLYNQIN